MKHFPGCVLTFCHQLPRLYSWILGQVRQGSKDKEWEEWDLTKFGGKSMPLAVTCGMCSLLSQLTMHWWRWWYSCCCCCCDSSSDIRTASQTAHPRPWHQHVHVEVLHTYTASCFIIIIVIIIAITRRFYDVVVWRPKPFREFIWWMQTERWMAAKPQTKPIDLGCESASRLLLSTSTVAIVIITQPVSWYSFCRPT